MNFLQSLVDELSTESSTEEQYSELLDYAIEATQLEINQVLGFSQAIESNYHHHFSNGDESFENYQAYSKNFSNILNAVGMDLPLDLVVPSFEAATPDKTGEKKDNIIIRAAKYVWDLMKKLFTWLGLRKDTVAQELVKSTNTIKEAKELVSEKVTELKKKKRKVKKTKDNPTPSEEPVGIAEAQVISVYAAPVIFPNGNKPNFKPLLDQIKNSFAFAAINKEFDVSDINKIKEVIEKGKRAAIPSLENSRTYGPVKVSDIEAALAQIDIKIGDEINMKYIRLHEDYYKVIHKYEADIKKLESSGGNVELMKSEQALMMVIVNDLATCTKALRRIADASKSFQDAVVSNFDWQVY